MSLEVSRADLERFRAAIVRRTGLYHDDAKLQFLGDVLNRRLQKRGGSRHDYLSDLETGSADAEISALARELTVGETYFFRNKEQFAALADMVIAPRIARGEPKTLHLLSAGCASGEEAYSLAILARETVGDPSWKIRIDAVDLNPAALEKAERARYSRWAFRDTPADLQEKWFRAQGGEMALIPEIRGSVNFVSGNLASEDMELWRPRYYDAIFCRNVLMYFAPDQMRAVIARMAHSLTPGGFLFLGHAETLRGVSDAFHLLHTHETFYYRLKGADEVEDPGDLFTGLPAPAPLDEDWTETIRKATERVTALLSPRGGLALDPSPAMWDSAPVFELIGRERFAEALAFVRGALGPVERDSDILLLEAALLVHNGHIAEAEDLCQRLLLRDEFSAGAHYLLALCCEHLGRRVQACEHDRVAAYLDPVFAMPRLHLGLLAGRSGDRDGARRELACALMLLEHEDVSRLLLFGGGFNRKALMDLCRSALFENGGTA